jgi:hypothetical protein
MGTGRDIETRGHVVGFKEEIARPRIMSPVLLAWFDDASGPDEAFIRERGTSACTSRSR